VGIGVVEHVLVSRARARARAHARSAGVSRWGRSVAYPALGGTASEVRSRGRARGLRWSRRVPGARAHRRRGQISAEHGRARPSFVHERRLRCRARSLSVTPAELGNRTWSCTSSRQVLQARADGACVRSFSSASRPVLEAARRERRVTRAFLAAAPSRVLLGRGQLPHRRGCDPDAAERTVGPVHPCGRLSRGDWAGRGPDGERSPSLSAADALGPGA
jgi:hypothetical protein